MLLNKDKLLHPAFVVTVSVALSATAYTIAHLLMNWDDFWIGFSLSAFIPFSVSFPISTVMNDYVNKINRQKKELEHLDTINKKLFLLISHDVRSPLASLKGMIDLVASDNISMEQTKLYLKQLSNKVDNVNYFLDGLLDWSRRQTQNESLSFETFNTIKTIKSTHELLEDAAKEKNIKIITKNLSSKIYADKDNYAFVFRNILHNAIKFTKNGGTIHITTNEIHGKIYTSISDSGVGIAKKQIDNILNGENWYTTKGTSQENGSGFGIRTSLYYLKKNNGDLFIESEVNHGTKMTIVLPKGN